MKLIPGICIECMAYETGVSRKGQPKITIQMLLKPVNMLIKGMLILCVLSLVACKKSPASTDTEPEKHIHGIIPQPVKVEWPGGSLLIDENIVLINNPDCEPALASVEKTLNQVLNGTVKRNNAPGAGIYIQFAIDSTLEPDAYLLEINSKGIFVKANNPAAGFYAAQSVCQLIIINAPAGKTTSFNLQQIRISDKPEFSWRGFHLDVSRHFFTKEYIFKIVDWLAFYKLNKLHLHLTDDQGWRIQIDQYPLLTQLGAWRPFDSNDSDCMNLAKTDVNYTIDKRFIKEINGQTLYGGFYSKQDIREIVEYAAARYIEVIPEIDMPGHMSAAIKGYPELSCVDSAGWGTEFSFPVCPCNDWVMDFCFKVWDEIAELFPSSFVHIGCDEVEKGTWGSSPACQAFMQQHGMTDLNEIQNYFVLKLQEHLQAKGKKVIAWDDVIEGNIDSRITVMYWREWVTDSPARSAENGNDLILTPWGPFYLASENTDETLQKLYEYNPSSLYPENIMKHVRGMQSCVWTEIVPSEKMFEYYVFPRLQALAEISWTPTRSWMAFRERLKPHFKYMDNQGINYRKPGWSN